MRLLLVGVIFLGIGFSAAAQDMPGVAVGKSAPTFQARDQFGKEQTISSLMGRNGLVLVFFRSADSKVMNSWSMSFRLRSATISSSRSNTGLTT